MSYMFPLSLVICYLYLNFVMKKTPNIILTFFSVSRSVWKEQHSSKDQVKTGFMSGIQILLGHHKIQNTHSRWCPSLGIHLILFLKLWILIFLYVCQNMYHLITIHAILIKFVNYLSPILLLLPLHLYN